MLPDAPPVLFRLASSADFPSLADLRYRLAAEDVTDLGDQRKDAFLLASRQRLIELDATSSVAHWVAQTDEQLIAALTIVKVPKTPAPDDLDGCWGYLTNVYTLPRYRNRGIGGALLSHARHWANAQRMELLIVWPGDRSVPFYQRAGFTRQADPWVLALATPAELERDH